MTVTTQTTHTPLLDVITRCVNSPEGCLLAFRSVHADFTSSRGYTWPLPGHVADAPGPVIADNTGPCPQDVGDGLCVALTACGMASGGIPASTVLVVAYRPEDVLGSNEHKVRVRCALVLKVLDLPKMAREGLLAGANLDGANLDGANLAGANLYRANLVGAGLYRADLAGANLAGANLAGANLAGAYLYRALYNGATRWPEGFTPPPR